MKQILKLCIVNPYEQTSVKILIKLQTFSLKKMLLKRLSAKCQPFLFRFHSANYFAALYKLPWWEADYRSGLTHWGRVTHICLGKLTIIGSDNGLSPGRRQAIIWTNDGILLCWPLGTNFSEIVIEIHTFSFKKMHLKMSSGKWQPMCLCLNSIC